MTTPPSTADARTAHLLRTLADTLPDVAERVLRDYAAFVHRTVPADEGDAAAQDKTFAARQSAGKAAVAHLEAVLKLLRTSDAAGANASRGGAPYRFGADLSDAEIEDLLQEVRKTLPQVEETP